MQKFCEQILRDELTEKLDFNFDKNQVVFHNKGNLLTVTGSVGCGEVKQKIKQIALELFDNIDEFNDKMTVRLNLSLTGTEINELILDELDVTILTTHPRNLKSPN